MIPIRLPLLLAPAILVPAFAEDESLPTNPGAPPELAIELLAGDAGEEDADSTAATDLTELGPAPELEREGWITLYDGSSMTGWEAAENPSSWMISPDGDLVAAGPRSHLFWVGEGEPPQWTDFDLELEVRTAGDSNSGVYVHTEWQDEGWPEAGMEAQINSGDAESQKTGSLYNVAPVEELLHADREWFLYRISVRGRRVQLAVDGEVVNDWTQPEDSERDRLSGGTIALQAHDSDSWVEFRVIRIRTEDLAELGDEFESTAAALSGGDEP